MQIGSCTPRFSIPVEKRSQMTGATKAAGTEKENFSSHFSSPDDVTVGRDSYGTVYAQSASPYIRLMEQYDRWKAQLPEQEASVLPDSSGLTEENIAYLKERYSGELTWMEREDALDTMVKMGIISNPQKFSAHGSGGWVCLAKGNEAQQQAELEKLRQHLNGHSSTERDWNVLFENTPIASFFSIENILKWVKELTDESYDPLRCRFDMSLSEVVKSQ